MKTYSPADHLGIWGCVAFVILAVGMVSLSLWRHPEAWLSIAGVFGAGGVLADSLTRIIHILEQRLREQKEHMR